MKRNLIESASLAVIAVAVLLVSPLAAQQQTQTGMETETRQTDAQTEDWKQRLTEIQKQLKSEEYEPARQAAVQLAGEMVDDLGGGSDAAYTLAVTSAYRAIAETGLGNREVGLWYWRIATDLYPRFADADLGIFGEPAEWLQSVPFRSRTETREVTPGGEVSPPKAERSVPATYPKSLQEEGLEAAVVAELVVDEEGVPSEPRIVSGSEVPGLAYAALDAIRQWDFEPARYNGAPVAVVDSVNVEFRPEGAEQQTREPRATYPEQ